MREIPAAVETLLKSRSMIGENKPSYEVSIQGLSNNGIDFDSLGNTTYQPAGAGIYTSSHQLNDGRILVVWVEGNKIKQGYAENADAIFANDCLTNITDIFTGVEEAGSILCDTDAGLYLLVVWHQQNADLTAKTMLYKSAIGDGSDWQLATTLQTFGFTTSYRRTARALTKIFKTGNRYILQCPEFYQGNPYLLSRFAIYSSTDLVNWSKTLTFSAYQGYLADCSSNFIDINNETYWAWYSTYGGLDIHLVKSTDGFNENQTQIFSISSNSGTYINSLPYSSCALHYDKSTDRFLIVGCQGIAPYNWHLSVFGCKSADITDLTKYEVYAQKTNFGNKKNAGTFLEFLSNGQLLIWGQDTLVGMEIKSFKLPVKSININRNKNMAGSLNLGIDNKNGEWSPDNTVNQNVLFPNSEITVKQGYGAELVQTFAGLIDRIEMTTFPQELKLSVRDKLKLALDQIIEGVLIYQNKTIEYIFTDLAGKAGLTTGDIEGTGLTIAEKSFSWETYADCFSWLADLVGFEFGCDEDGKVYFKKDAIPQATDWILTFTDGVAQAYFPIVSGSDILKSADGETIYIRDTDYEIDYETGELTSITIADGETKLTYVFAAYSFKEGEDIISLGYTIDDNDIYSKVVVYGKNENDEVISAYKDYVSKDYYNVLSQKIMKIDVSEASTVEQLQAIADRAEKLMRSRVRTVRFAAVAVPWLQVGDLIQVVESSTTISELYRVTDLSTNMDSEGYTMQITCYHHSA